jgi:hypothetical protein
LRPRLETAHRAAGQHLATFDANLGARRVTQNPQILVLEHHTAFAQHCRVFAKLNAVGQGSQDWLAIPHQNRSTRGSKPPPTLVIREAADADAVKPEVAKAHGFAID